MLSPVPSSRSMLLSRSKPAQRKLNIGPVRLLKAESKLLVQRSVESLKSMVTSETQLSDEFQLNFETTDGTTSPPTNKRQESLGCYQKHSIKPPPRRCSKKDEDEDEEQVPLDYDNHGGIDSIPTVVPIGWDTCSEDCSPRLSQITWEEEQQIYRSVELLTGERPEKATSKQLKLSPPEELSRAEGDVENYVEHLGSDSHYIDVGSGKSIRLRSLEEMWNAIMERRNIMKSPCLLCQQDLFCLEDAKVLSCPQCEYAFSPIVGMRRKNGLRNTYGVCIGVTCEDMESFFTESVVH